MIRASDKGPGGHRPPKVKFKSSAPPPSTPSEKKSWFPCLIWVAAAPLLAAISTAGLYWHGR